MDLNKDELTDEQYMLAVKTYFSQRNNIPVEDVSCEIVNRAPVKKVYRVKYLEKDKDVEWFDDTVRGLYVSARVFGLIP